MLKEDDFYMNKEQVEERKKELIEEGMKLYRKYKLDRNNILKMEIKTTRLEDLIYLMFWIFEPLDFEKIIEMLDNGGQYYLRFLAQKNMELHSFVQRANKVLMFEKLRSRKYPLDFDLAKKDEGESIKH